MLKVAVSTKVKSRERRDNHRGDVSIHYCLVPISKEIYDLAQVFLGKDCGFDAVARDLLKTNARSFALSGDEFLAS
jgi:hypothetical protein